MAANRTTDKIFDDLFVFAQTVRRVANFSAIPAAFGRLSAAQADPDKPAVIAEAVGKIIKASGLTHPDLQEDCRAWAAEQASKGWEMGEAIAPSLLLQRYNELKAEAGSLPNDLMKAQAFIAAMYRNAPSPMVIAYVHANRDRFRETISTTDEKLISNELENGDYAHPYERYRLLRSLPRQASHTEIEVLQDEIRGEFEQLARDMAVLAPPDWLPTSDAQLGYLWLCSRDNGLKAATFGAGRRLAVQLSRWQQPNGSWLGYRRNQAIGVESPALSATMLCLIAVYGDPEQGQHVLTTGVNRLVSNQRSDGSWSWLADDEKSDTLATLIALDALKAAATSLEGAVERASDWLLAGQDPLGGWPDIKGFAQATALVIALETLEADSVSIHNLERMMRLAREMLFKSEELRGGGQTVDLQLAVIAAHHACEMFLYGYFLTLEPQETFVGQDGRTIGLSAALGALQQRLVRDGRLSGALPHRQQVQQLSSARDLITHRGFTVSSADAAVHIAAARRFISHHSKELLGVPLV